MITIESVSRLPAAYQEVDYIQSSGTQYINTGVSAPSGFRCVANITVTANGTSNLHGVSGFIGAYDSGDTNRNFFGCIYSGGLKWVFGANDVAIFGSLSTNTEYVIDASTVVGSVYYKINGQAQSFSLSSSSARTSKSLYLFECNNNGSAAGQRCSGRLKYCQIYVGGTLVRNYVPCYRKSDRVAGLYDLVNNSFYTNAGSGSFSVGPDNNTNTQTTIVVTSGGVIPQKYALRRRMIVKPQIPAPTTATVQLIGTFYPESGSSSQLCSVTIGGVTYTSAQTLTVPIGTVITLQVKSGSVDYAYPTRNAQIVVNGAIVAAQPDLGIKATYNYTVSKDCVVEGFTVGTFFGTPIPGLRVTT